MSIDNDDRLVMVQGYFTMRDPEVIREREGRLPRAVCASCGGVAKAGEGTRAPEPPRSGLSAFVTLPDGRRSIRTTPTPGPAGTDDWRRTCATCDRESVGQLVSHALGSHVTDAEARYVLGQMVELDVATGLLEPTFPWAANRNKKPLRPWGQVTKQDRADIRALVREYRHRDTPSRCVSGPCGMCGVALAVAWHEGPGILGGRPLCGTCNAAWESKGSANSWDRLHIVGTVLASGGSEAFVWSEAPRGFRLHAEACGCNDGHENGWDYSDDIREFRNAIWIDQPHLAPAELRDEYQRVHDAEQAALRARVSELEGVAPREP